MRIKSRPFFFFKKYLCLGGKKKHLVCEGAWKKKHPLILNSLGDSQHDLSDKAAMTGDMRAKNSLVFSLELNERLSSVFHGQEVSANKFRQSSSIKTLENDF